MKINTSNRAKCSITCRDFQNRSFIAPIFADAAASAAAAASIGFAEGSAPPPFDGGSQILAVFYPAHALAGLRGRKKQENQGAPSKVRLPSTDLLLDRRSKIFDFTEDCVGIGVSSDAS